MPPLTLANVQARILARTGDIDPTTGDPVVGGGGLLSSQFALVWDEYADKAFIAPRLQELYVERDLFDLQIATIQQKFDFSDESASFKLSQRVQRLVDRRAATQEKLATILAMVAANRAPAVGQLTTTAPVGPPYPLGVDGNSPRYSGSPYYRRGWNYP